jgi:hypothetical protein
MNGLLQQEARMAASWERHEAAIKRPGAFELIEGGCGGE